MATKENVLFHTFIITGNIHSQPPLVYRRRTFSEPVLGVATTLTSARRLFSLRKLISFRFLSHFPSFSFILHHSPHFTPLITGKRGKNPRSSLWSRKKEEKLKVTFFVTQTSKYGEKRKKDLDKKQILIVLFSKLVVKAFFVQKLMRICSKVGFLRTSQKE